MDTVNNKPRSRRRRGCGSSLALCSVLVATGCGAPPSVTPLMRLSQRAMQNEISHVQQGIQRGDRVLKQRQAALEAGYDADLVQRETLTKQWVRSATAGYVAAREALLEQRFQRRQDRAQRIDNLEAASDAQQRAIDLIQRQNNLFDRTLSDEPRRWRRLLRQSSDQ